MHKALLSEKLDNSRIRCHICQWRCNIRPGGSGVCRMYQNREGVLFSMNYARASSVAFDPIEKKPLFHFYPGSLAFSIGGWGCNFHCLDCQNWQISCPVDSQPWVGSRDLSPEDAVRLAKEYHCQGIAWTYNEPAVWFEYTLDSAKLAKENNLYTVYVTNGFLTPEALDTIGPYLDAWRVDVKGFTDDYYQKMAHITGWRGILEVASRARHKWEMHVEVVTNIVPTMNDDDVQLNGIARWIKDELGELTPWHVTRFYPRYEIMNLPPTPVSTIERAVEIGHRAGLKFVYSGNIPGHQAENTTCYHCGQLVVARVGYEAEVTGLDGSKCKFCGAELNFRPSKGGRE
ncbi:MAG: AmmeMemoRadiSam system radical SAM enzyme [Chloroflexota bacterium]